MNRKIPRLILILLIVALACALLACSNVGDENNPTDLPGGDNNSGDITTPDNPSSNINKGQIFGEIRDGLVSAGKLVDEATTGTRYVDSKYTFIANSVNIGIEYQANYDLERTQDSEIMVRVFDYNKEENTLFVYFVDNDLYVAIGEEYIKVEDFGGTSTFQIFYETVTILDMEQTLFSEEFAENIEAMAASVDSKNISKIILSDSEFNVSVDNINLDTLKPVVNEFIQNNIATLGTRFDALTKKILGFELSDLGRVQIGLFNAKLLTVFEKQIDGEQNVTDFNINFAGNQANNIDTYYFDVDYSTDYKKGDVRLTRADDPMSNNYVPQSATSLDLAGKLFVPAFDKTFDAKVQGNFSSNDNSINQILIDIVDRTENQGNAEFSKNNRIFSASYKDGITYVDTKGLFEEHIGDFMEYEKLGLPRIKFEGLNMAEELQILVEKALGMLNVEINIGGLFGKDEDGYPSLKDNKELSLYLDRIKSDNGVFYILIDNELLSHVIGEEEATIVSTIANTLGLEEGMVRDIIGLGYFDDLAIELAWDTNNDNVIITGKAGENDIFVLTLGASDERNENDKYDGNGHLIVEFPEEIGYFDTFEEFKNPGTINLHFEGSLRIQGKSESDVSKLMGLFVGDVSGKNSSLKMTTSDELGIKMDLWQTNNKYYVNAFVSLNGTPLVDLCSSPEDESELLVNNHALGVKYVLPRETTIELIGILTESKDGWDFESIVDALEILATEGNISKGEYPCVHYDFDKDEKCDCCKGFICARLDDKVADGVCDLCNKAICDHVDVDANGVCDECNVTICVHVDALGDEVCDKCDVTLGAPDYLSVMLSPSYDSKGKKITDPLDRIFGIEDFMAELKVKISFSKPIINVDASEYSAPIINVVDENGNMVDEERWASIYEAKWAENAMVTFGNGTALSFKLTYEGESATIKDGEFEYYPEAKLFGQIAKYRMFITDLENGTKKVKELYSPDSTIYKMVIDPIDEEPIPATIGVLYMDGSIGTLSYDFVDFPYDNETVQNLMGGLQEKEYTIVIGKGSIAEQKFKIALEVKGRNAVANEYYGIEEEGSYYRVPIVAHVTIDPFQYYLDNKSATSLGQAYYPFSYKDPVDGSYSDVLKIGFVEYTGSSNIEYVELPRFDWGFDTSRIKYSGGEYTIVQKYKTMRIALVVTIEAKKFSHIQINTELPGQYTIDSLSSETYYIPSTTDEKNEVRIYFTSGSYRIIGNEPAGFVNTDPDCDGYYNESLDWTIKYADNVTVQRTINPLNNGKTNKTECVFGDSDSIGSQDITLEVLCPTREIRTRAQTVMAYTSINYVEGTNNVHESSKIEPVKVSLASFDRFESVYTDYYDFDPYKKGTATLPEIVYVEVMYQGRMQVVGYPVLWIAENNILEEKQEIIEGTSLFKTVYSIKNAFAQETYMRVRGVIGKYEDANNDGIYDGITQTLEMVICNHSANYSNVDFFDANGDRINTVLRRYNEEGTEIVDNSDQVESYRKYYVEGLNPYEEFMLPTSLILYFPEETGIQQQEMGNLFWYRKDANGDPIEGSAQGFIPSGKGGIVTVYTDVESADGIIKQTVELNLSYVYKEVNENRIYGLASVDEATLTKFETYHYLLIDPYDENHVSQKLYEDLYGITHIDVGFNDGTRTYGKPIEIEWINLEEFLSILRSPLGSSVYHDIGENIYFLRGIIRKGTPQAQEIRMGFRIEQRVLGDISFGNYDKNLSAKDENGLSAVTLQTEIQRVTYKYQEVAGKREPLIGEDGKQVVEITGENTIDIAINKYFALTNQYGLCTPSEYIEYIFSNVTLSFASTARRGLKLDYVLPENFDQLVYGNVETSDPNVTVTDTHVIFRFRIEKLTKSSGTQPFDVTVSFLKDNTILEEGDAYNEAVEVFDAHGSALYATTDGYKLDKEFVVDYRYSGAVKYTNLVWRAEETVTSLVNDEKIDAGAIVENVKYDFFNFTSTRIVKLTTELPNGQIFRRHITFYAKNVNFTKYHTNKSEQDPSGLYQIKNGTLLISNVYDYLPLENLILNLPTTIVPDQTSAFTSAYDIEFSLIGSWMPGAGFADDDNPELFDVAKLEDAITSNGLNATLLATNKIVGYNGEEQEIRLFVEVTKLSAGQISHSDYVINGNNMTFDQYANSGEGKFVLPKDIKVTFGEVNYEFKEDSKPRPIEYYIRNNVNKEEYTLITEIPYNNVGHTLSQEYGYGVNDPIYLKVALPDGNDNLRLIVTFPCRVLEDVFYYSKTGEGTSAIVNGIYYVDPYDRATFSLPTTAQFKYYEKYVDEHSNENVSGRDLITQNVEWTLATENAPFTMVDGHYVYDGGDYEGASYLFYSSLRNFDELDKEQYFILQVYVLNRTLTRPQSYPDTLKAENPFGMLVEDLPSTLSEEDFYDLSAMRGITNAESSALDALYESLSQNANSTIIYYDEIKNDNVSIYDSAYVSALTPVLPNVLWRIEKDGVKVDLVNDDIKVNGGFEYTIYGYVGNGIGDSRTSGQVMEMTFFADTWTFNQVNGLKENVIEFNDFTLVSIAESFNVSFIVVDKNGNETEEVLTFYPEYYVNSVERGRTIMSWNKTNWGDSAELGSITFSNAYKDELSNTYTTANVYKFDAQQVGIDELNFGFGAGYAYSGDVELVIDPLNPVIPTTALARGRLNLDAQTLIYLGEVQVDWQNEDASSPESIYHIDLKGGTRLVYCDVTSGEDSDTKFTFAVRVTYLDRTPRAISTQESGYTNVAKDGSLYPLLRVNTNSQGKLIYNYTFVVDPTPTDDRLFKLEGGTNVLYPANNDGYLRSRYTLPSTLVLGFANDYDAYDVATEALQKFGAEITLVDIEWVLSRDISLVGTNEKGGAISAKIRRFRVQYVVGGETITSDLYNFVGDDERFGTYLDLSLTTVNRQVEYTYVLKNGEETILSEVPEGAVDNYQQARDEFYIDPYNIAFPEDVYVIFTGSTIPYHATDIEWNYNKDFLMTVGVITGSIGEKYMVLTAKMNVYGTTLQVQFPIRARNIPVSKDVGDGQTTKEPMSGGTLYVLAGIPLEEQLPKQLYYRFDYDGFSEIAPVPLSFPAKSLSTVKTDVAGRVYSNVDAMLGLVDDDNVVFTIKVIDPKLYALRSTVANSAIGARASSLGFVNGGFIYDYIPIGINAAGTYIPGPETNILPDRIIVSEDGEYMEIVNIEYDVENLVANIECRYTFLSFNDSPRLSGDKDATSENSDKMFISFKMPIKTYSYNWIEEESVTFETTLLRFPLGTEVTASDLPLTTSGIAPIWELDTLNQNKAGEYTATCYYTNAYGRVISGAITVIIERRRVTQDDFIWEEVDEVNFRNREYSGEELEVKDFVKSVELLREDGSYAPINFTVLYSIDGRINWSATQPVEVKENADAEDYFIRLIVNDGDDYNFTGFVDYKMVINKRIINADNVFFYENVDSQGNPIRIEESRYDYVDENGASLSTMIQQVTFEYNGKERTVAVAGIPTGARTEAKYGYYNPNASQHQFIENLRPVNVGTYVMELVFTGGQRNYTIGETNFIIVIHVTPKKVNYTIDTDFEYTGEYFDVPVNGLPEDLAGIEVTYIYKNLTTGQTMAPGSKIKDAGSYQVTVKIDGGINYPSANVGANVYNALYEHNFIVHKRKVKLIVNNLSSEYLDALVNLRDSSKTLTLVSADNEKEAGLVGRYDTNLLVTFGDLEVVWAGGTLTSRHIVGSYPLTLANKNAVLSADFHKNYLITEVVDGVYDIVADKPNTRVIQDRTELLEALAQLGAGDGASSTAIWYLAPGEYGTITISKEVNLSLIGAYAQDEEMERIAVHFDQIIVNKGALYLDIVSLTSVANDASIRVGAGASALTVSRSEFVRKGTTALTNSKAIGTEAGYKSTVYVTDTYFNGYTTAIYLLGGSLELRTSTLYRNINGVYLQNGNIVLDTNVFNANSGYAVNITSEKATTSIFDNEFTVNDTAIKSVVALRNDIQAQNVFSQNRIALEVLCSKCHKNYAVNGQEYCDQCTLETED